MKTTTHGKNKIPVIIFSKDDMKFIEFHEQHKNDSIKDIAERYDKPPQLVEKWMIEGKRLKEL